MPRVMTPLLRSSPPINSISHRLFRCRHSNSRDAVASSPFYSHHVARAPRRACSQTRYIHNVLPTMLSIHLNIYPCTFLACRVSISSLVLISLSLRLQENKICIKEQHIHLSLNNAIPTCQTKDKVYLCGLKNIYITK